MKTRIAIAALAACAALAGAAEARDQIQIAGSSTVLPYAQIVAELFGEFFPRYPTPIVESGGTSGGLKAFCRGAGPGTIDIANASRPIRAKETAACAAAGVTAVMEVRFGYDGIVFATAADGPHFDFAPADFYNALAARVMVAGELAPNPNMTWDEVNPEFPAWRINVYIPGEKHGTREVFEEKVLEAGCAATGAKAAMIAAGMTAAAAESACIRVRKDGAAVDIAGDYTETLSRIDANRTGIGVFGLAFHDSNRDRLNLATMEGVTPSADTIASGAYPVSRPLFFYVKMAHLGVIPGLREYVAFFTAEEIIGPDGPLAAYGLVPAPKAEREALRNRIAAEETG